MKTISVEVPDLVEPRSPEEVEEFRRAVRRAAAVLSAEWGRISREECAEIAGLNPGEVDLILTRDIAGVREFVLAEVKGPGSASERPFDPEAAEAQYQALGRWKGPLAAKEVQTSANAFWRESGGVGARWLVHRLRDVFDIEAMHAAASALASMREVCLAPILDELSVGPPIDQAQVLLWALVSLAESNPSLRLEGGRAELVLADFLQHDDPDLRESAAEAMRLLRPDRAVRWLSHRLRDEVDAEVRRAIEDELARHQAVRT